MKRKLTLILIGSMLVVILCGCAGETGMAAKIVYAATDDGNSLLVCADIQDDEQQSNTVHFLPRRNQNDSVCRRRSANEQDKRDYIEDKSASPALQTVQPRAPSGACSR